MDLIGTILRWLFTYLVYPAIIIGIFVFVVGMIAHIVSHDKSDQVRTAVAAIVPVAALVFLVVSERQPSQSLVNIFADINPVGKFTLGAAIGFVLLELGKQLLEVDSKVGPPLYAMFLSMVGVFILYALMSRMLASIHVLLFGYVIGGGIHVIFRGFPE